MISEIDPKETNNDKTLVYDYLREISSLFKPTDKRTSEDSRCPCGVQIKMECHLKCLKNEKYTYVGSCCVKRFSKSLALLCISDGCKARRFRPRSEEKRIALKLNEDTEKMCKHHLVQFIIDRYIFENGETAKLFWVMYNTFSDEFDEEGYTRIIKNSKLLKRGGVSSHDASWRRGNAQDS